jgi:methylmalonyl-CoA mutase C-terminal domain/subunit
MKEKELSDVLLFGGGIIPDKDIKTLKEMGIGELFTPGTSTSDIVAYVRNRVKKSAMRQAHCEHNEKELSPKSWKQI